MFENRALSNGSAYSAGALFTDIRPKAEIGIFFKVSMPRPIMQKGFSTPLSVRKIFSSTLFFSLKSKRSKVKEYFYHIPKKGALFKPLFLMIYLLSSRIPILANSASNSGSFSSNLRSLYVSFISSSRLSGKGILSTCLISTS